MSKIPLRERKIFHVQFRDRWGWHHTWFVEAPNGFGTFAQAKAALRNSLKNFPENRYRIHFTIPADIGEGPKENWVNDVLNRATKTMEACPEWMKRPEFAKVDRRNFRCEGDLQGGNPCLNQHCTYCNPGL